MLARPATGHSQPRFVNPAPGGAVGRTDQGVDWSNIHGNIVAVAGGVISRIYTGLSGFGTTVVERLKSGQDVYYAMETGGGSPMVKQGQQVSAGQAIAPGLGSGGIEVGYWNPATGHAVGYVPGVTSGSATQAGQQFKNQIYGSNTSLEQLWIDAGGDPRVAQTMAAIALAESGGQVGAVNKSSGAAGLWQILPSAHPQFNVSLLTSDPMYNAQAAVAVYKSQGLGAWATYSSGAYRQYLNQAASASVNYGGPNGGITRPGGQPAGSGSSGAGVTQALQDYTSLRDMPRTAPPGTKNPFKWFMASFTGQWDQIQADS